MTEVTLSDLITDVALTPLEQFAVDQFGWSPAEEETAEEFLTAMQTFLRMERARVTTDDYARVIGHEDVNAYHRWYGKVMVQLNDVLHSEV